MTLPEVFHHICVLRAKENYRDLSNYAFMGAEKDFNCPLPTNFGRVDLKNFE